MKRINYDNYNPDFCIVVMDKGLAISFNSSRKIISFYKDGKLLDKCVYSVKILAHYNSINDLIFETFIDAEKIDLHSLVNAQKLLLASVIKELKIPRKRNTRGEIWNFFFETVEQQNHVNEIEDRCKINDEIKKKYQASFIETTNGEFV